MKGEPCIDSQKRVLHNCLHRLAIFLTSYLFQGGVVSHLLLGFLVGCDECHGGEKENPVNGKNRQRSQESVLSGRAPFPFNRYV